MPRAQQYLDVVSVIVVAIRRDESVELINRRGCEAMGLSEAELVGRNWFDVALPAATREAMRTRFGQVMRGEVAMVASNAVIELVTGRGPRTFAWTSDILRDPAGAVTGMLSSGEDITDRRRLAEEELAVQARLLAGQKLESLGLLASGIAHDFHNLLLGVRGHAELVAADRGLAPGSRDSARRPGPGRR